MTTAKNIYINYLVDVVGYSLDYIEEMTMTEMQEEVEELSTTDNEFKEYAKTYSK